MEFQDEEEPQGWVGDALQKIAGRCKQARRLHEAGSLPFRELVGMKPERDPFDAGLHRRHRRIQGHAQVRRYIAPCVGECLRCGLKAAEKGVEVRVVRTVTELEVVGACRPGVPRDPVSPELKPLRRELVTWSGARDLVVVNFGHGGGEQGEEVGREKGDGEVDSRCAAGCPPHTEDNGEESGGGDGGS